MYLIPDLQDMNEKEKEEYQASLKLFYILAFTAVFLYYLVPYVLKYASNSDFGSDLAAFALVSLFPMFVFIACMIHSRKYKAEVEVAIVLGGMFLPAGIVMYKTPGVIVFAIMYIAMGLFGEFTGYLFNRRQKSKKQPIGVDYLEKVATKKPRKAPEKKSKSNNKAKKGKK